MVLITQTALADEFGISRMAIQYAKKHNKIMMDGMNPKMVQLDHELTQEYIAGAKERQADRVADGVPLGQEAAKSNQGRPRKYNKSGKTAEKPAASPPPKPERQQNTQVLAKSGGFTEELLETAAEAKLEEMSARSLKRMKTYQEVVKLQVGVEEKRRTLVSIDSVYTTWAKFYAVHTSQLGPLGEKISAKAAAQLGTDDPEKVLMVKKTIDEPVYVALNQIKRLMNDFLERAGYDGRIE